MAESSYTETRFVICIRNEGYPASLEIRKIYQQLPDPDAAGRELLRIVDESGEPYLFPREMFLPIELSGDVKAALLRAS